MKVYKLHCRTGCTCCSYNNHYRGLYETKEEAFARKKRFESGIDNPVSSQYAKNGGYGVIENDAEEISNDRLIIENKVYPKQFIKVNLEDGSLLNNTIDQEFLESD